jgi:iron(III) transport system permease protein
VASLSIPLPRRRGFPGRLGLSTLANTALLALLGMLVLYPFALVLLHSFDASRPGQPAAYGLDTWRTALADTRLLGAFWNTVVLMATRQSIGFVFGILIAWLIARTDLPGARWLEFLFWIAFFLPALPVTLGWILMLDPRYGLLNQVALQLPFVDKPPFNIYTFWGIVWTHLAHNTIATKVILLTPAFRNLDASLEEASRVAGATTLGTLVRVVVPILAPAIVIVLILSMIHSMQAFEIEMILGSPTRFYVFSTQIYLLLRQERPLFAEATVLSSLILGIVVPLILIQRWVLGRRRYATVGGQFRDAPVRLRRWRLPALIFVGGAALITTLVPLTMLVLSSFMKLFGFFTIPDPYTTTQWTRVLGDAGFGNALRNTLILASSTAVLGVLFYALIAYVSVRARYAARGALDFVAWLPSTLPGIILGLGLLWAFLGNPLFQPFYGTMLVLVVAALVAYMTLGVQTIKSNIVQLGLDLEEAARVAGGSWWDGARYVILPLLTPVLLLVGTITFVATVKDVSTMALLSNTTTRPLALLQLDYMLEGRYEVAAVVGVMVVVLTTSVALIARTIGSRFGLRQSADEH